MASLATSVPPGKRRACRSKSRATTEPNERRAAGIARPAPLPNAAWAAAQAPRLHLENLKNTSVRSEIHTKTLDLTWSLLGTYTALPVTLAHRSN